MACTNVARHAALGGASVLRILLAFCCCSGVRCVNQTQFPLDLTNIRDNLELIGPNGIHLNSSCGPVGIPTMRGLTVHIGLSISFVLGKTYEIRGLLLGLKLWQFIIEGDEDLNFDVKFCIYDDEGDLEKAKQIYTNFVSEKSILPPHELKYHILFGPSTKAFHYEIAKITQVSKIPIVFWALEDESQTSWVPEMFTSLLRGAPDPWMLNPDPLFKRASQAVKSSIGSSNGGNSVRRLEESLELVHNSRDLGDAPTKVPDRPSRRATAADTDPDGPMWDQGYRNVFDINVPKEAQNDVLLKYLREDFKFHRIIIVDLNRGDTDCVRQVSEDATNAGFPHILPVRFDAPYSIPQLIFEGSWRTESLGAVWYMCGNVQDSFTAIMTFRAMDFMPKALVLQSVSIIEQLRRALPNYMVHYALAPKMHGFASPSAFYIQWPRIGCAETQITTFDQFNDLFQSEVFTDEHPTLSTALISAAWAVVFKALCRLKKYDRFYGRMTIAMKASPKKGGTRVRTFAGEISFGPKGKCATCISGVFQNLPLAAVVNAGPIQMFSDFRLVYPNSTVHYIPQEFHAAYAHMMVPSPTWEAKQLEMYPCDPGCVVTERKLVQLANGMQGNFGEAVCMPCGRGYIRSPWNLQCISCMGMAFEESLYADVEGLSQCKACPTGATCDKTTPGAVPIPNAGYYRIDLSVTKQDVCTPNYDPPEEHMFVPCLSPQRCIGNNKCQGQNEGLGCAQCVKGYTFLGMNPNVRQCRECPGSAILVLRLIFVFSLFLLLLWLLTTAVVYAARDTSNLIVPILLSLIFHFQMLGLVFYVGSIDLQSQQDFGVYSIPYFLGLLLTQPVHLMQIDCLWINEDAGSDSHQMVSVKGMFAIGIVLGLSGYAAILIKFLLRFLCRLTVFFAKVSKGRHELPGKHYIGHQLSSKHAHGHAAYLQAKLDLISVERACLVWSILSYPILLTASFMTISCIDTALDVPRLYNDLSIVCHEGYHEDFVPVAIFFIVFCGLLSPLLVLSYHSYAYRTNGYWNYRVIFTSGFLMSGYQLPYFHFGIWFIIRLAIAEATLCLHDKNTRIGAIIIVQFLFIVWYEICKPRASNDRRALGKIDQFSHFTLFLSSWGCFLLVPESAPHSLLDGTAHGRWLVTDEQLIINLVGVTNIFYTLYALHCLLYNRVLLPCHIHKKTGGTLNCFQNCLMRFVVLIHGFHSIRVFSGDGDEIKIDFGRIVYKERKFLLRTLQETLQVCVESVHVLDISMVIAAMNENFIRAGQTRDIRVMQDESGGNGLLYSSRNLMTKNFPAGMKNVDFVFKPHSTPGPSTSSGLTPAAGNKSISRFFDMEEHGITVDELYSAFQHVAIDVITHEPSIHSLNLVDELLESGPLKPPEYHTDQLHHHKKAAEDFMMLSPKEEQPIVKRLNEVLAVMGGKSLDEPVSWGKLQELVNDHKFRSELESTGLQAYDLEAAFISIAGSAFLTPGRTGYTGVNKTFVRYSALVQETARRFEVQNKKLKEMRQEKKRGETFEQGAVSLQHYVEEEQEAQAQDGRKALEERCKEALTELTALRLEFKRRQTKQIRAEQVKNKKVEYGQDPDVQRLFGGRDNPAITMDSHILLTKWARDENMYEAMPEPESLVSPRMRGIDFFKYAKYNTRAMENHDNDPAKVEAEMKQEASKPGEAFAELDLRPGGAVEIQGGAVGVAAAIMARAKARGDRPGAFVKPRALPQQDIVQIQQRPKPEEERQDALEFCFNAPAQQVHQEVFKAMMLSQLRGMAVPQKAIVALNLEFRQNHHQLIMDVSGPASAIVELRSRNLTTLKVMGHSLRCIQEPPERQIAQPSTSHHSYALEDSQNQLVAASNGASSDPNAAERSNLIWSLSELRLLAAARSAEKLKARGKDASLLVGEQAFGRINQINTCWKECLEVLSETYEIKEDWAKESVPDSKMVYGCQMGGTGYLEAVLIAELEGCDPFRAFSALQELNVEGAVQGPLHGPLDSANEIRKHGEEKVVGESLWRTLSESKEMNMKEDNVWQISMVDALDEPLRCLWVCACSTAEARVQLHPDLELPKPGEERTRGAHKVFFCIKPYKQPEVGFRLIVVSRVQLTPAQYSVFWMMPKWGLVRTVKPLMVDFSSRFRALASSKDGWFSSKDRMKSIHHEKVIGIIKEHFDGVKDKL